MPEKRAVQIPQASSPIEQRPLSDQERQLRQMGKIYGFLENMVKVMQHPVFDRYKTQDEIGNSWNIDLIQTPQGLECSDDKLFSEQASLTIQKGKEGSLIRMMFPGKSRNFGLTDPQTNEEIFYLAIYYEKEAAPPLMKFLRGLLGSNHRFPQEVYLYEHTWGKIPLAHEQVVDEDVETVLGEATNSRLYQVTYSASPDNSTRKNMVTFNTFPGVREDEEDINKFGFPQFQFFPMSDEHSLFLTQAIEKFLLPAFIREMQHEPRTVEGSQTRRLGKESNRK